MQKSFYPGRAALEAKVVELFARVTFGASGAPTLDTANSKGIASVSRVSAGKYDVVLSGTLASLLHASHMFVGSSAPAAPNCAVVSDAASNSSSPKVQIQFSVDAGTATDPADGDEVRLCLVFKQSPNIL